MALAPVQRLRNWLKFRADVREEMNYLVERHGARAAVAGAEEAKQKNLHPRRVKILEAAARKLER